MNKADKKSPGTATDPRLLLLSPHDNTLVLRGAIECGEQVSIGGVDVNISDRINLGHKLAATSIQAGEKILKYGAPIGSATQDIALGEHVHIHNMKSDYTPTYTLDGAKTEIDAAHDGKDL